MAQQADSGTAEPRPPQLPCPQPLQAPPNSERPMSAKARRGASSSSDSDQPRAARGSGSDPRSADA
eukprot:15454794-Alexandrium_andersonii.AAC.1